MLFTSSIYPMFAPFICLGIMRISLFDSDKKTGSDARQYAKTGEIYAIMVVAGDFDEQRKMQ